MHGLFLLHGCPQSLHLALFSQSVAQGTGKRLVEFPVNLGLKSGLATLSQDQGEKSVSLQGLFLSPTPHTPYNSLRMLWVGGCGFL